MFGPGCHWGGPRGRGPWGPWGFDPEAFAGFWRAGGGGGGGRRGPRGRVFESGDLKFVVLRLLEEKPRHGYEIIKELEGRFAGAYSPSPGTVYPTLSLLEDLGYARARVEEGSRKVYEITEEGRAYLAENRETVDDIFGRVADFGSEFLSQSMVGLGRAFGDLGREAFRAAARAGGNEERLRRIREVLERAAREIRGAGD